MNVIERNIRFLFRKMVLPILKYYPIVMNAFILLIFAEYMVGEYTISTFFDPIFGYSLIIGIFLIGLSYEKKFCCWHRMLIGNMIFNSTLVFFDALNYPIHVLIFIFTSVSAFTLLLSILMLYKNGWFTKEKKLV